MSVTRSTPKPCFGTCRRPSSGCFTRENGDPVRYAGQPFRYRVDFNHPGYVEHIKRVLRVAIEEVKADFIHLRQRPAPSTADDRRYPGDQTGAFANSCTESTRRRRLKERFGFSDISNVRVPSWSGIANPAVKATITDPLLQEWIDFRCYDLADYYGKLATYIRQLNPNVVVELNPHGISGANRAFLSGVDHARLVPHGSVFWTEESNDAQVDAEGILVSKIRSFKVARTLDRTLFRQVPFRK